MLYRDAVYLDWTSFLLISKKIHAISIYKDLRFSEEIAFTRFGQYLEDKRAFFCKLAEEKGVVVGALFGRIGKTDYSEDKIASDVYFYVEEGFRKIGVGSKLVESFIDWAGHKGARRVQMQNGAGIEKDLSLLFEKSGLEKTGEIYGMSF